MKVSGDPRRRNTTLMLSDASRPGIDIPRRSRGYRFRIENPSRIRACEQNGDRRAPGFWLGSFGLWRCGHGLRRRQRRSDDLSVGDLAGDRDPNSAHGYGHPADANHAADSDRDSDTHTAANRDTHPAAPNAGADQAAHSYQHPFNSTGRAGEGGWPCSGASHRLLDV